MCEHGTTREPFLVEPGFTEAWPVWGGEKGDTYRILAYRNGDFRFEHRCVHDEVSRIVAPLLRGEDGFMIADLNRSRKVTVTPSISCPDCGLHGRVTRGWWNPNVLPRDTSGRNET